MRTAATLLLSLACAYPGYSQIPAYRPAEGISFFRQGRELPYALCGGLEAPQFSMMDFNGDGLPGLLVFDRVGAKALPFVAVAGPEGIRYAYTPAYEAALPPLNQMAMVVDLNCDGLPDLLTTEELSSAADVALKVYLRQPTADGSLSFRPERLRLYNSQDDTLVRIHAFDLPAISDIDGDGLPDLLYIPQGGAQIQYYQNISLEAGSCDSLAFVLQDDCWGEATYTLNGDFELGSCEPGRGLTPGQGCAGSAMLAFDEDGDGDGDLLFSGLYGFHIQLLANGGDAQSAQLSSSSTDWLYGGEPLLEFPAPFLLSLDGEGSTSLAVATNRINGAGFSPSAGNIYHFRRDQGDGGWNLQSRQFMRSEMADHGFRSSPAAWDMNGDGLADLLIACNAAHPIYGYTGRIAIYLNTGSPTEPAFSLANEDFGALSIYNLKSIHPAVGDLNGDGIPELVLGLENGRLQAYTNSSGAMDNYFPMFPDPFAEVALNGYARPQLIDVDEDGALDLLCGTRNGTIALIGNSGTAQAPGFSLLADTVGGIVPEGYFQECSPFFRKEEDGTYLLYYGQVDGTISLYQGRLGQEFTRLATRLSAIDVGERATLALHDLNGDGEPELIVGNMRGGIEIFEASLLSQVENPVVERLSSRAFPNPAREETRIEIEGLHGAAALLLFDAAGRLVRSEQIRPEENPCRLSLHGLEAGLYFYRIQSARQLGAGKLLITK